MFAISVLLKQHFQLVEICLLFKIRDGVAWERECRMTLQSNTTIEKIKPSLES